MKPIYRRLLIFVLAVLIVAGGYFSYRLYVAAQHGALRGFSEARSQGAVISEKIVASSNDIAALVARIGSPTSTQAQVSSAISEVVARVDEVRAQALELAKTLETMTLAAQKMPSGAAQDAALGSISNSLSLVGHLVTYTEEVSRLALAMRLRLENGIQNSQDIALLIKQINAEVAAINNFSQLAKESMEKFDSLSR